LHESTYVELRMDRIVERAALVEVVSRGPG